MSFEEVDHLLIEALDAVEECNRAAIESEMYAKQSWLYQQESQYWAEWFKKE